MNKNVLLTKKLLGTEMCKHNLGNQLYLHSTLCAKVKHIAYKETRQVCIESQRYMVEVETKELYTHFIRRKLKNKC